MRVAGPRAVISLARLIYWSLLRTRGCLALLSPFTFAFWLRSTLKTLLAVVQGLSFEPRMGIFHQLRWRETMNLLNTSYYLRTILFKCIVSFLYVFNNNVDSFWHRDESNWSKFIMAFLKHKSALNFTKKRSNRASIEWFKKHLQMEFRLVRNPLSLTLSTQNSHSYPEKIKLSHKMRISKIHFWWHNSFKEQLEFQAVCSSFVLSMMVFDNPQVTGDWIPYTQTKTFPLCMNKMYKRSLNAVRGLPPTLVKAWYLHCLLAYAGENPSYYLNALSTRCQTLLRCGWIQCGQTATPWASRGESPQDN